MIFCNLCRTHLALSDISVVSQVIPIMLSGRQPLSGRFEESVSLIGLEVVTSSSLGHSVVALIGRPNCTNQSQCREGGHYI